MIVLYIYVIINALKVVFLNLDQKVSYPGPYGFVDLILRDPELVQFSLPREFLPALVTCIKNVPSLCKSLSLSRIQICKNVTFISTDNAVGLNLFLRRMTQILFCNGSSVSKQSFKDIIELLAFADTSYANRIFC